MRGGARGQVLLRAGRRGDAGLPRGACRGFFNRSHWLDLRIDDTRGACRVFFSRSHGLDWQMFWLDDTRGACRGVHRRAAGNTFPCWHGAVRRCSQAGLHWGDNSFFLQFCIENQCWRPDWGASSDPSVQDYRQAKDTHRHWQRKVDPVSLPDFSLLQKRISLWNIPKWWIFQWTRISLILYNML